MTEKPENLVETTISRIVARIDLKNKAREQALSESRQVIRNAANSIRATHRKNFDQASALLEEGRQRLVTIKNILENYPDLYWAGYVQDAQKEYAEARLTFALVNSEPLPSPEELGVEDAPYLNGLGEAASELRRYILDMIRHGHEAAGRSEELLDRMEEVYSQLVTIDYPDVLTGGLRRTTDLVRGVLERTRGDLTLTLRQQELEAALERAAQMQNNLTQAEQ
ncbi:MAG TPA: haloacid dehalogenase [Chloroflexia bacterium]|nr:haloacid dehalogenase [Chloroflexia bacterium]